VEKYNKPIPRCTRDETVLKTILAVLVLILITGVIILSWVPPVSRDALIHHLALPKLYLKHGGVYEIPFMSFSYYPMNIDFLYLIPLYFGSDIVPKFIHFGFALLTAWLIFYYLRCRINQAYAMVGVVFFLSIPIIVKLSITVYVDLGLIFFSTASLLFMFKWIESRFSLKHLIISAVFCGLALGTKYNGLIVLFLLTLFIPYIRLRHTGNKRNDFLRAVASGMLFCIIALLIFSPWMIRNYHWTGNPIFPLYDNWFNPQTGFSQNGLDPFTVRKLVFNEYAWEMILVPLRVFFEGQDGNPQYFDGKLNPFLLLFTIFAFWRTSSDSRILKTEKKTLLAFSVLYFAFAFFRTDMRIRYISPIIPPLVILSAFGIRNVACLVKKAGSSNVRRIGRPLVYLIVAFALYLNADYVFKQFKVVKPFGFLSGAISRGEYIERYRGEYPAMRFINQHLPPDSKILFIYVGNRGYYCDRDYLFGVDMLAQIVKRAETSEQMLADLFSRRITHLLIRKNLFEKWINVNLDANKRSVLVDVFRKHFKKMYFKQGYGVYRLEYSTL
jgi:4-amino-4-deoxy-L-arabinose transferase-like glycosyltransferase